MSRILPKHLALSFPILIELILVVADLLSVAHVAAFPIITLRPAMIAPSGNDTCPMF